MKTTCKNGHTLYTTHNFQICLICWEKRCIELDETEAHIENWCRDYLKWEEDNPPPDLEPARHGC